MVLIPAPVTWPTAAKLLQKRELLWQNRTELVFWRGNGAMLQPEHDFVRFAPGYHPSRIGAAGGMVVCRVGRPWVDVG